RAPAHHPLHPVEDSPTSDRRPPRHPWNRPGHAKERGAPDPRGPGKGREPRPRVRAAGPCTRSEEAMRRKAAAVLFLLAAAAGPLRAQVATEAGVLTAIEQQVEMLREVGRVQL